MRISRRTRFALPLVLVVGCGSPPRTSTTPTNTDATTENENLPPPPGSGKVTKSTTEEGLTLLTYESGDRIYVQKDGTCHAEYDASCGGGDGPEVSTCNPPPPQQVKCPSDAK